MNAGYHILTALACGLNEQRQAMGSEQAPEQGPWPDRLRDSQKNSLMALTDCAIEKISTIQLCAQIHT
jgi:hypothetical protein